MATVSQLLPVHEPSRAYAVQLCAGLTDPLDKWEKITRWVSKSIHYDYIRALTIKRRGELPDLDRCWDRKMGVCLDIASLTVGMLRAVGINAQMVWGNAETNGVFGRKSTTYHAWVEAIINGRLKIYDHDKKPGQAVAYSKERTIG